ncbi:MAG: hypothetical protein ABW133_06285 [Polyangiaceae bacterium]
MTQSPLLGFNNNVKHRGRLFHIQTEDSGVRHPHVITHLFMDGGRILKTIKTSYAEHVGSDKMQTIVRDLMKEQHKMMFIALRDGQFDHALDSVPPPSMSGPPVHPHGSIPASARLPDTTSLPPNSVVSTAPDKGASVPVARASATATSSKAPSTQAMPAVQAPASAAIPSKVPSSTGAQKSGVAAASRPAGAPAMTSPPVRPPSGTMPAVQMPAAAGAPPESSARPQATPPGSATGVRPVPRREAPDFFGAPAPEAAPAPAVANVAADPGAAAAAAASGAKKEQPGSGRYAASRPAAIFTAGRNADAGGSIFGDDLISEKSLDEVILSYLSDDLETPKK